MDKNSKRRKTMNRTITKCLAILACILTTTIMISCGDNPPNGPTDDIAPRAISDLTIDSVRSGITYISWTATGDDDSLGKASSYEIRYAADSATLATWSEAIQVSNPPSPSNFGVTDRHSIPPSDVESYYIAIKAADEAGNKSLISNIVCNAPKLDIEEKQTSGTGCASIIVPILAHNFDKIAGIELHIGYNQQTVACDSIRSSLLNDEITNISNGTIHLAWANISNAITPSNGDTLALLYFSNLTGVCNLTFTSTCELANKEGETLQADFENGSMTCN
jgi:hypothetical protein